MRQCFFLLFFVSTFLVQAQKDSTYVQSFINKVNVRSELEFDTQYLTILDQKTDKEFQFLQNPSPKLTFVMRYRFLGARLSLTPYKGSDLPQKGVSDYIRFKVQIFFPKVYQRLYYFDVKGFYLQNTSEHVLGWNVGDSNFLLPSMRATQIGSETTYFSSNKFTYRSVLSFTEKQIQTHGSWLATLRLNFTDLNLPENNVLQLNQESFDADIYGGYMYNIALTKNIYTYGKIEPGFGVSFLKTEKENSFGNLQYFDSQVLNTSYRLGFGIGSSTPKFYYGANYFYRSIHYRDAEYSVRNSRSLFSVHFGYRFNTPKKLKLLLDKVESWVIH